MNSIRAHVFAQRALRIVSLALALTGVSIPAAVLSQTPTVTDVRQFDVPAGPLPEALTAFAAQAGISLSFDPTRYEQRRTAWRAQAERRLFPLIGRNGV